MEIPFEWDPAKAEANFRKHRVTFDEATTAFADPLHLLVADPEHSTGEERWILVGRSHQERLLVVVHAERGDRLRIVSARRATAAERKTYEQR